LSEEIRKRGTTLTSIIGAEQKRATEEGTYGIEGKKPSRIRLFIFLGGATLLLVLGGVAVGIALLLSKPSQSVLPATTIIPINRQQAIESAAGGRLSSVLASAKDSASLNLGEVEELRITQNGIALTPAEILTSLGAPNELARNATGIMVGVHAFDHNQPFLLISVAAYDLAFQSMLAWEQRMDEGLGDFFKPSTLANSSVVNAPPALTFSDRVFENIDIRESQPAWHIIYTFPRPDLILITTNESTLREIVTRLSLQKSN
jgi:hypothetical protein